jgi:hypothetical protein
VQVTQRSLAAFSRSLPSYTLTNAVYMDNDTLFKVLAVVSPFISGYVTYWLTNRSKKSELLYQHRMPAFKEVVAVLVKIRQYAEGKIALERGAEFSPYFDEAGSALSLRTELANASAVNEIFLTDKSKRLIQDVDSQIGIFCNAEIWITSRPIEETESRTADYTPLHNVVERSLKGLYKEMNLPDN